MISIAYFTTRSHTKMVDELTLAGICVWEALSVSEVLYLQEHEKIDLVVIDVRVDDVELASLKSSAITLELQEGATVQQIVWELTGLFGSTTATQ